MPDCEQGERDEPWPPPPLIDRPVLFIFIVIRRRGIRPVLRISSIVGNRLVTEPPAVMESLPAEMPLPAPIAPPPNCVE